MRRTNALGEGHHFFGHAHLEIHARLQYILEHQYITLLDVPPVFAQVHGDAIGPRFFSVQCRLDRVRVARAACLAQGGHVVDIDAKKDAVASGHGDSPED
ncbi:hypothetical protein D9M73_253360 [compost metagenome]